MTVEQKKSRQSSYFPETKASPKKKYYGKIEMFNLEQDDSNDVIADDDPVIDDPAENMSSNPQNVPKGINRLSCKSDITPELGQSYCTLCKLSQLCHWLRGTRIIPSNCLH